MEWSLPRFAEKRGEMGERRQTRRGSWGARAIVDSSSGRSRSNPRRGRRFLLVGNCAPFLATAKSDVGWHRGALLLEPDAQEMPAEKNPQQDAGGF